MKAQLVIFCKPNRISARIQHFFARDLEGKRCDEYPYHGGILVGSDLYDMNVKLRRIDIGHYDGVRQFRFDLPFEADTAMMDAEVDKISYGAFDVALYPLTQHLGWNLPGVHCMEWCNDVMWWHGMRTPWFPLGAPPSPCATLRWAASTLPASE